MDQFRVPVNYDHYAPMLYMIPFLLDAKVVVETGLGEACSTHIFLTALSNLNNPEERTLHTYEIAPKAESVDKIKNQNYKPKWVLHSQDSIQGGNEWQGPINFLYLDSDHGVNHVYNELNAWARHLDARAVIVSDDTWINNGPDLALQGMRKWLSENNSWKEFTFIYPKGQTVLYR
jgi:hypothetical protein